MIVEHGLAKQSANPMPRSAAVLREISRPQVQIAESLPRHAAPSSINAIRGGTAIEYEAPPAGDSRCAFDSPSRDRPSRAYDSTARILMVEGRSECHRCSLRTAAHRKAANSSGPGAGPIRDPVAAGLGQLK